jgi:UDP-N-acetylmuramyl tripeptide synthase
MAKLDDVVVITGLGVQPYRRVGAEKLPWNERAVVEEIIANLPKR